MRIKSKSKEKNVLFNSSLTGYAMILPALLFYVVFVFYPILGSIILSFYKWDGARTRIFIFISNYTQAFKDSIVWVSFKNNAIYTGGIILFGVFPGLILANLLAKKLRGRAVFQAIFFFPRLLTQVIVAIVWGWIFNPIFGLLNYVLRAVGLGSFVKGWLGDPRFALWAIIVAGAWTYFGFCMVIFLAALQNTDPTLHDAARIDGANALQTFLYVTIPQIKHVITMVIIYTVIDSFKVFDLIYIMTRGGPGNSTQIMATYIYQKSFRECYFGYGASIAVLLTIFILMISALSMRYREKGR